MRKKFSGFTLIELLVVIVIIGLLTTISTATFKAYFGKARDAERQSAIETVARIIKVDGASDWKNSKYVYNVPDLDFVFKNNDYRPPKSKKKICYIFGSASGENSYIGDDNEFVFMTWGETTGTWDEDTPGVIIDGTDKGVLNVFMADLDVGDFECDKSTVLAEMAFETGLSGTPLYYLGINEDGDVFQWGGDNTPEPPAPSTSPTPPAPPPPPPVQCSSFRFFKCIINSADCRWNWWFGPCQNR